MRELGRGLRQLGRAPVFALTAVITLAIGIGASTLVYSLAVAVLWRPLPYAEADRLVLISPPSGTRHWEAFVEMKEATRSFTNIGAYSQRSGNVALQQSTERILYARVTPELLSTLGVRPLAGRLFKPADFQGASADAVLLAEASARRWFGRPSDAVGRHLRLDDRLYTITGVLPPGFRLVQELRSDHFTAFDRRVALLLPASNDPRTADATATDQVRGPLTIVARLGAHVLPSEAMEEIAGRQARAGNSALPRDTGRIDSLEGVVQGELQSQLAVLMVAVLALLLAGCANVSNLFLQRLEARTREFAIHAALGATRWRLAAGVLYESALLAAAGGVAGLALAWGGVRMTRSLAAAVVARIDEVTIAWPAAAVALGLSMAAALGVGVLPALRFSRPATRGAFSVGPNPSAVRSSPTVTTVLVAAQVCASVILVIISALLSGDLLRLISSETGFDTNRVLTAEIALGRARYRGNSALGFFDRLLEEVRALPGVESAALVSSPPGSQSLGAVQAAIPGRPPRLTGMRVVSPEFFEVVGVPVLEGKTPDVREIVEGGIVVNEAFSHTCCGGPKRAVGEQVLISGMSYRITGVVGDTRDLGLAMPYLPRVYFLYRQLSLPPTQMTLLLRTNGDARGLVRPLAALVNRLDSSQPLYNVLTLQQVVYGGLARHRLIVLMLVVFGGASLLLGAVGVHGVVSYAMAMRVREIGIRVALGGTRPRVLLFLLRRAFAMVGAGVVVGIPIATGLRWFIQSEVVGTGGVDPLTCLVAALAVASLGLLAAAIPAWRATTRDPMLALRCE